MAKQPIEQIEGQTEIPVVERTVIPPSVTMLKWALSDLERVADSIYDSYEEIHDQLVFLGHLQACRDQLGKLAAAIEARCAGAMPRARINDPDRGMQAAREQRFTTTWEARRLLHDLLVRKEVEGAGIEEMDEIDRVGAERDISAYAWRFADYVLLFGSWTPKVTPLREELDWETEDINAYRKTEKGARKVKVTLTRGDGNDQPDDGEPSGLDTAGDAQAAGEDGQTREAVL